MRHMRETAAKMGAALAQSEQQLAQVRQRTAPRRLTAEQRKAMMPILARLRNQPVAIACRMMDGESCDYGEGFVVAFRAAGCQTSNIIKTSVGDFPGYIVLSPHGASDPAVLRTLAEAFKAAGIEAREQAVAENQIGAWYDNTVHVIIGRKAP